jgi:hypothetical protein
LECEDPVSVRATADTYQRTREVHIRFSGSTDMEQRTVLVSMDEDNENRQLCIGYFYNRRSYSLLTGCHIQRQEVAGFALNSHAPDDN